MKGKKWRDVRNALVMVIVMVAMMSSATFAWFTMTSSPTVTGLQMTASSGNGLQVCETANGDFVDAITLSAQVTDTNKILSPVSVKKATGATNLFDSKFYEPVYVGNTVTKLKDEPIDVAALNGYVVKYEYYMKALEKEVAVGLVTVDPTQQNGKTMGVNSGQALVPGTCIRTTDSPNNDASKAIRVGIVADGKMIIYEPNYETADDTTAQATNGIDSSLWPVSNIVSDASTNKLYSDKGIGNVDEYTSKGFFKVGTTAEKVVVYIWLEGTDDDCVDAIMKDVLEAQLQFTVVEDANYVNVE